MIKNYLCFSYKLTVGSLVGYYRMAGNFRGSKHSWLSNNYVYSQFVDIMFVVDACTAGKGGQ